MILESARWGAPPESVLLRITNDTARRELVHQEITAWNADLLPSDRAEKFEAMAEGAFAFFRGSNHLYWMDLGQSPLLQTYGGPGTVIWLQGDLHVSNFGVFDDDGGRVVYGLNDFDEAFVGDYQLDLWRLAASVVLVGRDNGLPDDEIATALDGLTEHYLDTLDELRKHEHERVVHAGKAYGRLDDLLRDVEDHRSRREMLDEWTTTIDGAQVLDLAHEDLEAVDAAVEAALVAALPAYGETLSGGLCYEASYFAVKSVARRLHAGIGSLGSPRYYVLIEGPSDDPDDDVLLDIKRQGTPTGLAYMSQAVMDQHVAWFSAPAERVVRAEKALGTHVDDHLGGLVLADGSYTVRARSPYKASLSLAELDSETRLTKLAEQWGSILAAAHARSDEGHGSQWVPHDFEDEVHALTDGKHAELRALVREVAFDYATQVAIDYGFFLELP